MTTMRPLKMGALAMGVAMLASCGTTDSPTPTPVSSATTTSTRTTGAPASSGAPSWSTSTVAEPSSSGWDNPSADDTSWPTPTTSTDHRSANPTGKAGTARGMASATAPDLQDPSQVARAFVATAWSYDTALDQTPSDAGRRAAALAAPELAEALRKATTHAQPGAWWDEMASHQGYTTTHLVDGGLGEAPSDTPTLAQRAITVTATPHGAGGWVGAPLPAVTLIITCGRANADQPWKVSGMRVIS